MIHKKSDLFKEYVSPRVEWENPLDADGVLCQSPQTGTDLDEITIGDSEEEGWLN